MFYIFTHCNQKNSETSQTAVLLVLGMRYLTKISPLKDIIFLQRAAEAFFFLSIERKLSQENISSCFLHPEPA